MKNLSGSAKEFPGFCWWRKGQTPIMLGNFLSEMWSYVDVVYYFRLYALNANVSKVCESFELSSSTQ